MSKALTASTTIGFSTDSSGLRLVEDKDRDAEPESRTNRDGLIVSCNNKTFVRLYPPATPTTRVIPATGRLVGLGNLIENDVEAVITFSPDSSVSQLPRGVSNVRIEMVGTAFHKDGTIVRPSVAYDAVREAITIRPACYCVVKVTHDAAYSLYEYTFSGSCPDNPPPAFDSAGNALPVEAANPKYFADGLISAIDPAYEAYATLTLEAPECSWSSVSVSWLDSDKDRVVPTLALEIDPDYPPRIVSLPGSSIPEAEAGVRAYPAGAAVTTYTTAGSMTKHPSGPRVQAVMEVVQFQNSAAASLKYQPAGTIAHTIIGTLRALGGSSVGLTVVGPGSRVIDVTYLPNGNGRYTNPRPRTLGPNEVAVVDMFGHPVPVSGLVSVSYSTTYDWFIYVFERAEDEVGGVIFNTGFAVALDATDRATHLQLSPPSTKDKSKSMR